MPRGRLDNGSCHIRSASSPRLTLSFSVLPVARGRLSRSYSLMTVVDLKFSELAKCSMALAEASLLWNVTFCSRSPGWNFLPLIFSPWLNMPKRMYLFGGSSLVLFQRGTGHTCWRHSNI